MIESKYVYRWIADYADGSRFTQEECKTVDVLDKEQVVKFHLVPMCSSVPPLTVHINLAEGERLVSYWLVDLNVMTGTKLYRHVVGLEKNGFKSLVVVSPDGKLTICTNDNQSYAGE